AHNGFSRPLQGVATIMQGKVTSGKGQIYFDNSNYINYDQAQDLNWGAMLARVIGTRPLNESILMSSYFRSKGYKAQSKRDIQSLGERIQLNLAADNDGIYDPEVTNDF